MMHFLHVEVLLYLKSVTTPHHAYTTPNNDLLHNLLIIHSNAQLNCMQTALKQSEKESNYESASYSKTSIKQRLKRIKTMHGIQWLHFSVFYFIYPTRELFNQTHVVSCHNHSCFFLFGHGND